MYACICESRCGFFEGVCTPCNATAHLRDPPTGSLLSMVESHVLMVAEVFRHDQTLPRKSGSWPTRGLFHELRRSLWCSLPTPRFQALPGGVAAACRAQQDAH